ncbi:hypothetical protein BDV95DRAFT_495549 [Massariosphaeria phaeospora]|uniref:DNA repair protein Rad26 n=1 Tax=Massariosphaeria phaeospora TaxID=100035 RepID=A0A7C8I8G8_9PLEO|nr:hypothetical protein BDV95DRAFT_495549 [Massariosphaeria phaeospora]
MDDDSDYSDHDLDDLPANTLQHLETTAIRATQHHDGDYSAATNAPESDYGLDEEEDEVVNLDDAAGLPQSPPWPAPEQQPPPQRSQPNVDQLLQRIKKLEQEKARLNRDLQGEKSRALSKSGEADTLRRRAEAATRGHEQKVSALQQSHSDAIVKVKAELDKMRREREQVQTNNLFLEHDLAREADKAKRSRRHMPSRPKPTAASIVSPSGTPKRAQKTLHLRDGFDDDDIVMASPTRLREKSKALTPKQAGKRKRQVADQSPIQPLQLSEPRERPKTQDSTPSHDPPEHTLLRAFKRDDERFSLLHRLLSHRSSNGTDRILEALAQYAFPSQPQKRLSSIVYDSLSVPSISANVHELALGICRVFISLWKQSLEEKYYAAVFLILDALHFVLAWEPGKTAVAVTAQVVPLIIASVDLVAIPVARAAKGGEKDLADLYSAAQRQIARDIDVADCLELLYVIATSCVSSPSKDSLALFWQTIPSDFALILLNKEQPVIHISLMLRILSTSALHSSLGPIVPADSLPESQGKREADLIHRLTNLFSETPTAIPEPESPPPDPCPAEAIWDLRLSVLDVLTQFSIHEHGSARLASHRACVGRLIKYLDFSISALYAHPLFPTQSNTIASINATMKLVYHLHTSNPGFDIKSKLVGILGGQHAYLVALTRLAFSDGLVLERGIEDAVVDMAHGILDEGLSIEEGEGLLRVFSSGNSV